MRALIRGLTRPNFYRTVYPGLYGRLEVVRGEIARLLGAPEAAIALASSTSEALAMFLSAVPLEPGDVVAVARGSFVSVPASLLRRQAEGVIVAPIGGETGRVTTEDLAATPPRTRAVVVDWVNYFSGTRNDIHALARWCRGANLPLLVDGVQGVGAVPVDFDLEDVAGLACGGHKWLRGPEGTGFLYVAPWALPLLVPSHHGYRSLSDPMLFDSICLELSTDARVFEVGTLNTVGFIGLGEAIRRLRSHGMARQARQIQANVEAMFRVVREDPLIEVVTPSDPDRRAGILSFRHANCTAADFVRRLAAHGVSASARRGCIRLSPDADVPIESVLGTLRVTLSDLAGTPANHSVRPTSLENVATL